MRRPASVADPQITLCRPNTDPGHWVGVAGVAGRRRRSDSSSTMLRPALAAAAAVLLLCLPRAALALDNGVSLTPDMGW